LARILIVDDDEGVRALLRSFAEKQGHEAICAGTGGEALEKLNRKPDLVLLDIMLPDIFGLDLLGRIKETDPSVGVIMVTGVADHALGVESLKRGAFDFVTKPVDLKHLENLIDFHLLRTAPDAEA
jgi:DNA-binding response OmpR family regulator